MSYVEDIERPHMSDRREPSEFDISQKFDEVHLRLNKLYEDDFTHHEDIKVKLEKIENSMEPIVKLFDNASTVARFAIWLTKLLAAIGTFMGIMYAAVQIIKESLKH